MKNKKSLFRILIRFGKVLFWITFFIYAPYYSGLLMSKLISIKNETSEYWAAGFITDIAVFLVFLFIWRIADYIIEGD